MTSFYNESLLRGIFQLLMTLGSVSRIESLYKANISNLYDFILKQSREIDTYRVLIMKIGFGNIFRGDHMIYARSMRHRDVSICPIGALGLWLQCRFSIY